jgi:hypothetical protein
MGKKRFIVVAALVAIAVLAGLVGRMNSPVEPMYRGKTLSFWLQQYYGLALMESPAQDFHTEADEAVREIGTNGIPLLLQKIRANDSPLDVLLQKIHERYSRAGSNSVQSAWRRRLASIDTTRSGIVNFEAARAFGVLGAGASNAVPELIKIYRQNTSEDSQDAVVRSLGYIGPAARNAVPLLWVQTRSTNDYCRMSAIWALGEIHTQPETVVPALMSLFQNADPMCFFASLR